MSVITIERHGRSYQINDPGGHIGHPIGQGRPYEAKLLDEVYRRGLKGSALDVGAHVGNHALFLAAVCDLAVVAVEPNPRAFEALRANAELNPGLSIRTLKYAAGRADGRGRLTSAMEVLDDPDGEVEVIALDEFVDLPDLALVKVDVEGFEHEVLAGLVKHLARSRPIIYAETHTRTAGRRTAAVLEPLGYSETHVLKMGSPMACWQVLP